MELNLLPPEFRNNTGKDLKDITYQNTGYQNTRLNKKILNIDSGILQSTNTEIIFVLELQEKFRIDKKSDIYLDSLTTHNCKANNNSDQIGFLVSIKEINNSNSFSNTQNMNNKIFIPNDATAAGTTITHKGKKLNYIGTVNPIGINKITITFTDLVMTSFNHAVNQSRFLMELIFVENE